MKSMRILGLALMMLMAGSTQAQTVKETADSVKASVKSGNVKDIQDEKGECRFSGRYLGL